MLDTVHMYSHMYVYVYRLALWPSQPQGFGAHGGDMYIVERTGPGWGTCTNTGPRASGHTCTTLVQSQAIPREVKNYIELSCEL